MSVEESWGKIERWIAQHAPEKTHYTVDAPVLARALCARQLA